MVRVRVRVTLQLTVSQSVCLGVEPNLGLLTRDIIIIIFFFFESYSLVLFGAHTSDYCLVVPRVTMTYTLRLNRNRTTEMARLMLMSRGNILWPVNSWGE
jgi:hypothetical protein